MSVIFRFIREAYITIMYEISSFILSAGDSYNDGSIRYHFLGHVYRIPYCNIHYVMKPWTANNERGEDITNVLKSYLGPHHNWHGCNITPEILGFRFIDVIYYDSKSRVFMQHLHYKSQDSLDFQKLLCSEEEKLI